MQRINKSILIGLMNFVSYRVDIFLVSCLMNTTNNNYGEQHKRKLFQNNCLLVQLDNVTQNNKLFVSLFRGGIDVLFFYIGFLFVFLMHNQRDRSFCLFYRSTMFTNNLKLRGET